MKKLVWTVLVIAVMMIAASCCSTDIKKCDATVIDYIFVEDDNIGYRAVGVTLKTEDGERARLWFKDIDGEIAVVSGGLEILAGPGGARGVSCDDYMVTFILDSGKQVPIFVGADVELCQTIDKRCHLYDPPHNHKTAFNDK